MRIVSERRFQYNAAHTRKPGYSRLQPYRAALSNNLYASRPFLRFFSLTRMLGPTTVVRSTSFLISKDKNLSARIILDLYCGKQYIYTGGIYDA